MIKAARFHQWAKNTLIFVPAILSGTILDPVTVINCGLAFLALGFVALGTYLVNDLLDINHDRRHWSKRLLSLRRASCRSMKVSFPGGGRP